MDTIEKNKHIISTINANIVKQKIYLENDENITIKTWSEIRPIMSVPTDETSYDDIIVNDVLYTPQNVETCMNRYYNELFFQDDGDESCRKTKMQQYLDWLRKKYSNVMGTYFNDLKLSSVDMIYWFVNTYDKLRCIVTIHDISENLNGVIWKDSENVDENEAKNWLQFLTGRRDISEYEVSWMPKNKCTIYMFIIEDRDMIYSSSDEIKITDTHLEAIEYAGLFLNRRSRYFLKTRVHEEISVPTFMLINTYRYFQLRRLKPDERKNIMFVGGLVKSLWGVELTMDADYLVAIDQNEELTKFKYKPSTGVEGLFDDYGLTYYYDESFYYKEEDQESYQIYQKKKYEVDENVRRSGLYPKCVSGLRIGRYFQYFKQMVNLFIQHKIKYMDDVVYKPTLHYELFGMRFMLLEFEFMRDKIKTIDLGRFSKKQLMHFYILWGKYDGIFSEKIKELFVPIVSEWKTEPAFELVKELYHTDTEISFNKSVVIRKVSKFMNNIIKMLTKGLKLAKDEIQFDSVAPYIYENIYLTSLPNIVINDHPATWTIYVTPDGEVNGCLYEEYSMEFVLKARVYVGYMVEIIHGEYSLLNTIFEIHKFYDKGKHVSDTMTKI